jgi:hypothetical protein
MRKLRRVVDMIVPFIGIALVLGAVLFIVELRFQVIVVILGILVIEAGIWKVAHPLLPEERRYLALRKEGDDFIRLIRRLNLAALELKTGGSPVAVQQVEQLRAEMTQAIDRMVQVAGKTQAEMDAAESATADRPPVYNA